MMRQAQEREVILGVVGSVTVNVGDLAALHLNVAEETKAERTPAP
jgi:hypothetical protein